MAWIQPLDWELPYVMGEAIKRERERDQDGGGGNIELASSQEHNKITAICWTIIGEKDWNLPENVFYN